MQESQKIKKLKNRLQADVKVEKFNLRDSRENGKLERMVLS